MPLCSAVVVIQPAAIPSLCSWLSTQPAFTAGPIEGSRLAVVIEGASSEELTSSMRLLADREGVQAVLPVFHSFEDEEPASTYGRRGARG